MRGRGRTETVRVSLTPAEKERWSQEAGEEALAVWIRQTINGFLARTRDDAAHWAGVLQDMQDDTNPEIEDPMLADLSQIDVQGADNPTVEMIEAMEDREQRADALLEEEWTPEKWEALPEAPPLPGEDRPFDPNCPNAPHHWLVPRNQVCPDCGGLGR